MQSGKNKNGDLKIAKFSPQLFDMCPMSGAKAISDLHKIVPK
jgi:hypothetical protein